MWNRRGEVDEVLKAVSKARVAVRHAMERDDPLFGPVNMSGTFSELSHSYSLLQLAMPYAVCCTCQGISSEKCAACRGRGFISKHHYEMSVPVEVKAIRSKSCVL
jgi:DnaJ-class molecular chaperone